MSPVPETVKIVYKAQAVGSADRGQPGVEAQKPAEPPHSSATGGDGAGDEGLEVELLYRGEELEKVLFEELRLLFGDVVGTSVDYESIGIGVGLQDSWDFIHDVQDGGAGE